MLIDYTDGGWNMRGSCGLLTVGELGLDANWFRQHAQVWESEA